MEKWLKAIKDNEERFPGLRLLLSRSEASGTVMTRREMLRITFMHVLPATALLSWGILLGRKQAEKSPPKKMSSNELIQRGVASTTALAGGRAADLISTRAFLVEAQQRLREIEAMPELKQLPPDVRKRLLPDFSLFEGNPFFRSMVKNLPSKPWRIPFYATRDAGLLSAGIQGISTAAKMPGIALPLSLIASGVMLAQAIGNMRASKRWRSLLSQENIRKEITDLHSLVEESERHA